MVLYLEWYLYGFVFGMVPIWFYFGNRILFGIGNWNLAIRFENEERFRIGNWEQGIIFLKVNKAWFEI